ncbi:cytochrome c oxidase subunit 3 [Pontivivens insulae]|uniref:Cytochrome c oxidase subunit 3 n=1 Tax=Pontivivens insulae TaxID=1639689 RepID=A0A2R8A715_9RHOB|nr:cytochrome c oxidase subunit 3 [Pontivivens insulae]RED18130.1 cytochrome c oxidase subunit 3 [Pontivivens insulae]SPF28027.1 Cytochrome c oxidase subunit 3 [Pontivivens insulae]
MAHAKNHDYHILTPSVYPFVGAIAAFVMLFGAVLWMSPNVSGALSQPYLFLIGFAAVLFVMFAWWSDVVRESRVGDHTPVVQIGLRYGMILFITSEVFFFLAWFWSFFKHAIYPMEAVGGVWPPVGVETFDPWHLPLINTLILLLSGCAATWAHHAIVHDNDNKAASQGLIIAVILGVIFSCFQVYEYTHAAFGFADSIYGANFFMATGFHGAHVFIGTVFLLVCYFRARKNHFTAEKHLGFEAAAWYWHFVDVVWLFLFAAIYVWGA